jgi:hypothetical protein
MAYLLRIRDIPGSNLGTKTDTMTEMLLHGFPQYLEAYVGIIP